MLIVKKGKRVLKCRVFFIFKINKVFKLSRGPRERTIFSESNERNKLQN